jgi:hypothetical protein
MATMTRTGTGSMTTTVGSYDDVPRYTVFVPRGRTFTATRGVRHTSSTLVYGGVSNFEYIR